MKHIKGYSFQGLYAITDAAFKGSGLANQVAQAIAGGARVIQYRDKTDDSTARHAEASEVLAVCRASGVPLLINDDPTLAAAIGADGVHLGKDDARLTEAREQLGHAAIIGVSCYNRLELAQQAIAQGADYVAFGRFFNSHSKPTAIQADPELLHTARHSLSCPIVPELFCGYNGF